jgi:16S rRNA (cytidine1402-2'-O)-methyltransferase
MLYICPTPIGNLLDVTLRVLEVLKEVELIACEDTRHTSILLRRYGITTRLVSFHDYNEEQRLGTLLSLLREGGDIAVVSDAGMPGLSDPGFSLVRACAAEGLPVTVLPGPSAISTALVLSGLPSDRFAFVGFLARGKTKLLEQLGRCEGSGATLVAFESPRRIEASLRAIAERWPERPVAVCRELTKVYEEAIRGTAVEVLQRLAKPVRGEIVLVVSAGVEAGAVASAGGAGRALSLGELEERARAALAEMEGLGVGTKRAAGVVAQLTGLSARRAYELALAVKEGDKVQK